MWMMASFVGQPQDAATNDEDDDDVEQDEHSLLKELD